MDITGKIIEVLPIKSGTSKTTGNEWQVQEYVLEEVGGGQFPQRVCFSVFGADKIQQFNIQKNDNLTVSFDINAREYQGRWFNSLRAWRVVSAAETMAANTPNGATAPTTPIAPQNMATTNSSNDTPLPPESNNDDLPF